MKKISRASLLFILITFSGCDAAGTTFKLGMRLGIIIVLALAVFLFSKAKKKFTMELF